MIKKLKIIIIIVFILLVAVSAMTFWFLNRRQKAVSPQNDAPSSQSQLPASQPASTNTNQTTEITEKQPATPFVSGEKTDNPDILKKYGMYAFETLKKYPGLVHDIRIVDPGFNPDQMETSFPSHVYHLNNGKDYLALGGCTAHNCGGTVVIILCNVTDKLVYIGRENAAQSSLDFTGNPSQEEKNTMLNFYLQE